jgi:uncharacterized protein
VQGTTYNNALGEFIPEIHAGAPYQYRRYLAKGWDIRGRKSLMMRILLILFVFVTLIYAALCAVLFVFQRSFIYFPQPRLLDNDSNLIKVSVNGAELNVTVRPHKGSNALIYFGGNAEDVSRRLPSFSTTFPDHALYLLHYREYGGSSGKPSETALFEDAIALFDKVHANHANVLVIGRSLGSGVAVYLASQRPVARLVLVTPFNSIQELASQQFPFFPVRWLLLDKFESWKYAKLVNAPTLIIMAEQDEVIPRKSTETLLKHFRNNVASIKILSSTSHNTVSDNPEYIYLLREQR